jgi:hypothetical protein
VAPKVDAASGDSTAPGVDFDLHRYGALNAEESFVLSRMWFWSRISQRRSTLPEYLNKELKWLKI